MNNNSLNLLGQLHLMETRGYSAYEVAVINGFEGTEEEWLASLVGPQGPQGPDGRSAYQVSVDNGYIGTESDWVNSFLTPDGYYNKDEIDLKKATYVNSVSEMKELDLKENSFVVTAGYYEVNDGGGALYKIVEEESETEYQEELENGLYATLIKENNTVNVKQFGAKGDGETDDTSFIQNALDYAKNIFIPKGTYMVNAITSLNPISDSKIELSNDAIIKAITTNEEHYNVIDISGVSHVEISGGTISGERTTHMGNSGEWGHCISINTSSSDIFIHDINLIDAWGDGIYINTATNIRTQNVHVDNTRRNGYSLIAVQNFSSNNDVIENVDGTNPKAGVDIEPNTAANILKNIVFNHLTTKNNGAIGFSIALNTENTTMIDVVINDLFCENEKKAIVINASENSKSYIKFNNPYLKNNLNNGVLANVLYSGNTIELNKIIIDGYNLNESTYSGISIIPESNKTSGRIIIKEPTIINEGSGSNGSISFTTRGSSYPSYNCSIINPIYIEGDVILDQHSVDLTLSDIYGALTRDSDSNITIKNNYKSVYTSSSYTADRRLTLAQNTTPVNDIITFRNTGDYTMTLRFTDQYIYPLSSAISKDIELTEKGSSITIKKISSTEWIVTEMVGTPTVV